MSEPIVTIKNEDGTTSQVPLSQLSKHQAPPTPEVEEAVVSAPPPVPITVPPVTPESVPPPPPMPKTAVVHRVTLDEVQQQKASTAAPMAPVSTDSTQPSASEPNMTDDLAVLGVQELSVSTPNTGVFEHTKPTAAAHVWDADDHVSPLEETLPDVPAVAAPLKKPQIPIAPEPTPLQIAPQTLSIGTKKVPMQDITSQPAPALRRTSLSGPVGELESMTLDDFRRLGGRDTIGLAELRDKFTTLLKESTLLYVDGVRAWHRSPLYASYTAVTAKSVESGAPIASVVSTTDITFEEWNAINALEQDVRL